MNSKYSANVVFFRDNISSIYLYMKLNCCARCFLPVQTQPHTSIKQVGKQRCTISTSENCSDRAVFTFICLGITEPTSILENLLKSVLMRVGDGGWGLCSLANFLAVM